jgi:hypothetical protein
VTGGYVLLLGMVTVITEAVSAHAALIGYVFDPVAAYGALATDIATETGSADLASSVLLTLVVWFCLLEVGLTLLSQLPIQHLE